MITYPESVMDYHFATLKLTRKRILDQLDTSPENISRIPSGFRNNLLWNAGHILVVQQFFHYTLCGLQTYIPEEITDLFKKGSIPSDQTDSELIGSIRTFLLQTSDLLMEDYKAGKFKSFTPYVTGYGMPLNSIEEAIIFNNVHEAIHTGYMMAQRKAIGI